MGNRVEIRAHIACILLQIGAFQTTRLSMTLNSIAVRPRQSQADCIPHPLHRGFADELRLLVRVVRLAENRKCEGVLRQVNAKCMLHDRPHAWAMKRPRNWLS